jgi:hypothetical protein
MKIVYWRIQGQKDGWYIIEFWLKKDRSDLETIKMVTTDHDKIRHNVEKALGNPHFTLKLQKNI